MRWCSVCGNLQPGEFCPRCHGSFPRYSPPETTWHGSEAIEEALALVARQQEVEAWAVLRVATEEGCLDERVWLARILLAARMCSSAEAATTLRQALGCLPYGSAVRVLEPGPDEQPFWEQELAAVVRRLNSLSLRQAALFLIDLGLALCCASPTESAPLWVLKAEIELACDDMAGAVGSLGQARALGDTSDAVHYILGLEHERRGDHEQALASYAIARRHAGVWPMVMVNTARLLGNLGRTAEALACCKDVVTLGPESADVWKVYTKLALRLGLNGEARQGIDALERLLGRDSQNVDRWLAGYPAPPRPDALSRPEGLFSLKLARLLDERGLVAPGQILVRDWCFGLPSWSPRRALGRMAGQSLTVEVLTRGRRAFVSCHAPAPRMIDAAVLGPELLEAWSLLLERGRISGLTFVGNTVFAPSVEASVREASERLGETPAGAAPWFSLVVVGERAGLLG